MSDAFYMMRNHPEEAATARSDLINMLEAAHQRRARLDNFANSLPRLSESDLAALGQSDSTCPICLTSLLALLAEEEMALAMDSPAHPAEELGVTRLVQTCGHVFCRKDIREWLFQGNTTCPTCRRPFMTPSPEEARAAQLNREVEEVTSLMESAELQASLLDSMLSFVDMLGGSTARSPDGFGARNRPSAPDDGTVQSSEGTTDFDYDEDRSEFSGMYS
ncbi:hypothetical protein BD414DRAFT_444837 [Trametes punicea]|nr:hypothetical protein BD414DRAFT_444837 [Trametes punicea]